MIPLNTLSILAKDLLVTMVTISDIRNSMNSSSIAEDIRAYEELRRHAIPRYERETCRCNLRKDPEQRSTILPSTRRLLLMQNGKYAKSNDPDIR
jgi:hypothetical protein